MAKIDFEKVEYYKEQIKKMADCDLYHRDSPELQIETLSGIVGALLESNKNGENDRLIAFFTHTRLSAERLANIESTLKRIETKDSSLLSQGIS